MLEFVDLLMSCGFRIEKLTRIGIKRKQMLAICTSASFMK